MLRISINYRARISISILSSLILISMSAFYLYTDLFKIGPETNMHDPDFIDATGILVIFSAAILLACIMLPNFTIIRLRRIPKFLYWKNNQFFIDKIPVDPSLVSRIEKAQLGTGQWSVDYYTLYFIAMPESLGIKAKGRECITFLAPWKFLSIFFHDLRLAARLKKAGFKDDLLVNL